MKAPLKIALLYCLIGILWITLSDRFLLVFLTKNELLALTYLQTIKGFFYVFSTATLLYFLIQSHDQRQRQHIRTLEELNANLIHQREIIERTHHDLEESEKRYSNLFQICPLPMWVFDSVSYKFLDVNLAAISHYGYSRDEFLNMTIMDIRPANEVNRTIDVVDNTLSGNDPFFKGIFHHVKKDDTLIEVEIRSDFFVFKGNKARIVLINDVTELLHMQRSLKEAYENIIHSEDRERERFAAELHDGITQNLVAIKHFISMVDAKEQCLKENPIFAMLEGLVDNTIKECRQIVYDMRPKLLFEIGLHGMLISMCDKLNLAKGIQINYILDNRMDELLQPSVKFHIYRLLQENFNNTLKHAQATQIDLQVICENKNVTITFLDNGIGLDSALIKSETCFLGIKHRLVPINGAFTIESVLGTGTKFTYTIPFSSEPIASTIDQSCM